MLFARFHHIYTHKFESAYRDEETSMMAKKEWALSLEGKNQAVIEYALTRCKETLAWPPTISEFLALCVPSAQELGLPDAHAAYVECCQNAHSPRKATWSHAAVYEAGLLTDFYGLRTEPEARMFPLFRQQYRLVCERVANGESFNVPEHEALPEPKRENFVEIINTLTKQYKLSEKQSSQLFYYLTKTPGSGARALFRDKAIENAQALGLHIEFPA